MRFQLVSDVGSTLTGEQKAAQAGEAEKIDEGEERKRHAPPPIPDILPEGLREQVNRSGSGE